MHTPGSLLVFNSENTTRLILAGRAGSPPSSSIRQSTLRLLPGLDSEAEHNGRHASLPDRYEASGSSTNRARDGGAGEMLTSRLRVSGGPPSVVPWLNFSGPPGVLPWWDGKEGNFTTGTDTVKL